MDHSEKAMRLILAGFYVGPRPPHLNTSFEGRYCVCDIMGAHPQSPPQKDAQDGDAHCCFVGDDLNELIDAAFSYDICDNLPEYRP